MGAHVRMRIVATLVCVEMDSRAWNARWLLTIANKTILNVIMGVFAIVSQRQLLPCVEIVTLVLVENIVTILSAHA